jgi:hypothetical protein
MAKENLHKKGPHRMATASKPESQLEIEDRELDATIKALAEKANRVIQKARSKMTPEDRERADQNANAILDAASAAAREAQRRA